MGTQRPFSKLRKQIENLFEPELKMQFCCYAYPMRSQYGSTIPRYCLKMGKEIIWDYPKDANFPELNIYYWCSVNNICELVRDYIDTPVEELLTKKFSLNTFIDRGNIINENFVKINLRLVELFIVSDRRIGKAKLMDWADILDNTKVDKILKKRFNL